MLDVRAVFESERKACERSFATVDWQSGYLTDVPRLCPSCDSPLVYQADPNNTDFQSIVCCCKACGETNSAEALVVHSLERHLYAESYIAMTDGGEPPLHHCPECGLEAYVTVDEQDGCLWCGELVEGECARCYTALTPDNVDPDYSGLCSYCGHLASKDD